MNIDRRIFSLFFSSLIIFFSFNAVAAKVIQIKGSKILIDLEEVESTEGEEFFLINPETNKKTAIIRIKQVKNGKAIAEIIKGTAGAVGNILQAKSNSGHPMSAAVPDEASTPAHEGSSGYLKSQKNSGGILGEYIMTSMSANFTRLTPTSHSASTDMKGTGLGLGGFYNYMLTKDFSGFAEASYQQFNAAGSTPLQDCDSSITCSVNINYLSLYGSVRYYFTQEKNRFWGGVGFGYLLALSKSSSVLNSSQISSNQVITFSLGGDYQLSKKNFIPYGLEYAMFPSSGSVTANMIILKGGYGWNF